MRQIQRCEEATVQQAQGLSGILISSVVSGTVLFAAQSAFAAAQVTQVALNPSGNGASVLLTAEGKDTPQIFASTNGKRWVADIANSQLKLASGSFQQANPADGIASVSVTALDQNRVRLTIEGKDAAPEVQVVRSGEKGLLFTLEAGIEKAKDLQPTKAKQLAPQNNLVAQITKQAGSNVRINVPAPENQGIPAPVAQAPSLAPFPGSRPLMANPEVRVQGPAFVPGVPNLPRAIAPPVGDIATGQIDATPSYIDLGTAERVPRLVLRDAPAREVLALLARAARLNLVFTGDANAASGGQQQGATPGATGSDGPRVTLDIENEPVQNAFNYVLQVSGLEANRIGRTIFVGKRLPNSARNMIVRSLRLNQAPIANALNYLVALGAESAISRERLVTNVNAVPVGQLAGGGGTGTAITQTQTTTEQRIETQRVDYQDSTPLLRGMQVSGDERTNTVTLIGTPRQVELAIAQLTQLDIRRRQVAVNVRVIDVNLSAIDNFSSTFSFNINNVGIAVGNGVLTGTFNDAAKPRLADGFGNFFGALQAAVTNNNAKVLVDPTLMVQEGQTATVNVTEEVVTNFKQEITGPDNSRTITVTVEKARAGLILPVKVDRIDDNGFISLSVAPTLARPYATQRVTLPSSANGGNNFSNDITLLSERRVESGQIRLRDGQTLLLSGVVQDTDRTEVTKVPILGDIPILGVLFRRSAKTNERREVIVMVTPRILDDSERSTFGYGYTPGSGVQKILDDANK